MADIAEKRIVDLSHVIEPGMTTYKGLPGPIVCDYWTREASAALYDDGSSFQIGRIDMVANTGTYLDSPFHRYAEGADLARLELESVAALDGLVVRAPDEDGLAIDAGAFAGLDLKGKAVLVARAFRVLLRRRLDLPDRPHRHGGEHRHLSRRAVPPICRR